MATATISIKMVSAGSLCLLIRYLVGAPDKGEGEECRSCAHTQLQGGLGDAWVFNFCHNGWALPHYYYKEGSFLNLGKGFK